MTKPFDYLLQGALKMCRCNDGGAGKPVLLVSYNDNIFRLYDLPTYGCFTTITRNLSSKSKGILEECCSLFTDSREQSVLFIAVSCIQLHVNHCTFFDSRFAERAALFSREEVRALQVGPGGLLFSGDSRGTVKVWRWTGVQLAAGGG